MLATVERMPASFAVQAPSHPVTLVPQIAVDPQVTAWESRMSNAMMPLTPQTRTWQLRTVQPGAAYWP